MGPCLENAACMTEPYDARLGLRLRRGPAHSSGVHVMIERRGAP